MVRYSQFLSPAIRLGTPIYDLAHPNIFINMNFYQHAKKNLYWRYIWFKNPAISLAKSILTHISASETFPNMRLVQAYNNQYKTFIIDQIEKKILTKFSYTFKKPSAWPIFSILQAKIPKKLKSQFQENRRSDRSFGHGWESNKRISQLRGIAVDNKDNFQYNSTNRNSLT